MKNVIIFAVDGARFAVELRWVREVITMGHVTPIPGAPAHVAGAINVRGVITPVIDLRVLDRGRARAPGGTVSDIRPAEPFEHSHSAVLLDVEDIALGLALAKVDEVATAETCALVPDHTCAGVVGEVLLDSKKNPVRLIDPPALVRLTLSEAQELAAGHPAHGRSTDTRYRGRP